MMDGGFYVRSNVSELTVGGDGRTVSGLLAPYNEIARVDDGFGPYWETFDPGCFERPMKGKPQYLRLQLEHNGHWVGRGDVWRDGPDGLAADLRLDNTEAGREAAFKIRDGQTPGLSLAFVPGVSPTRRHSDGRQVVHRQRVKTLHHVALCMNPAYSGAQVEAVRSAPDHEGPRERLAYWQQWTERIRRA
jgi:HK97 family phage prohead protease